MLDSVQKYFQISATIKISFINLPFLLSNIPLNQSKVTESDKPMNSSSLGTTSLQASDYQEVDALLQDKATNLSSEVKTIIASAIKRSKNKKSASQPDED